jgi:hypothetical protein
MLSPLANTEKIPNLTIQRIIEKTLFPKGTLGYHSLKRVTKNSKESK